MRISVGNGQRLWTTLCKQCRKTCIFNISSTPDPIFDNPWEWSFSKVCIVEHCKQFVDNTFQFKQNRRAKWNTVFKFGCSYLVSIPEHSHQIEAIWIALFLFEHSLESKICGLYIHTTIFWGSHCVPPLHESKSNGEGIHPSTWKTWICFLTFA